MNTLSNNKQQTDIITPVWKKRLKIYFKKQFQITTWDITLMGVLMAAFIASDFFLKTALIGVARISFEYVFYILFGIIFGPFKGAILSLLADSLSLLIVGRIGLWMWQFAIVPLFISILAALFYEIIKVKSKWVLLLPLLLVILALSGIFIIFFNQIINQKIKIENIKNIPFIALLAIVLILSLVIVIATSIFVGMYLKTNNDKYKQMFFIISLVAITLILARWIWGPIAFIAFWNRFIAGGNPTRIRTLESHFVLLLSPIVLKSVITIPLYSIVLILTTQVILKLRDAYYADQWKTSGDLEY